MPEEREVQVFKRQCASQKARVTVFRNYIDSIAVDAANEQQMLKLESKASKIDDCFDKYSAAHYELEKLVDVDINQDFIDFEESFHEVVTLAQTLLSKLQKKFRNESVVASSDPPSSGSQNNATTGRSDGSHDLGVIVPKVDLNKFDGNFGGWLEFRDTFICMVHENDRIKNMQNFVILKTLLIDSAKEVINDIDLCADNYENAWAILRERYDNARSLKDFHMNALTQMVGGMKESSNQLRTFADIISKHLSALKTLGQPVDNWDALLIHIFVEKLDIKTTRREWEIFRKDKDSPTIKQFIEFLKSRADLLSTLESQPVTVRSTSDRPAYSGNQYNSRTHTRTYLTSNIRIIKCAMCAEPHYTSTCPTFLSLSLQDRRAKTQQMHLCFNCLKKGHARRECRASSSCRQCGRRHHTSLHEDERNFDQPRITRTYTNEAVGMNENNAGASNANANVNVNNEITCNVSNMNNVRCETILPTAQVFVYDALNNKHTARILLDSGSQSNFITSRLANALQVECSAVQVALSGISLSSQTIESMCNVKFESKVSNYQENIQCYVLPQISSLMPRVILERALTLPANIQLADPTYNQPGPVDMLIGSQLFWTLLCMQQISLGKNRLTLQNTKLGWVISGQMNVPRDSLQLSRAYVANVTENNTLDANLTRFWELEECSSSNCSDSINDMICEKHFKDTTLRDHNGRFIVSIPLCKEPSVLGDSLETATKRFMNLEKRLLRKPELYEEYKKFISEYLELGHMSSIPEGEYDNQPAYYLPHHCVHNESSISTKLRVVFDGSSRTSTGISLNDIQRNGPALQCDIISILLRFRIHKYIIAADIKKMYRQILIKPEQRDLQRILWRFNESDNLKHYRLNTVTYGTRAASFLAIRCIFEIANKLESTNPTVATVMREDHYVDDLLSGADTIKHAIELACTINFELGGGCFPLAKWVSNERKILNAVTGINDKDIRDLSMHEPSKTLGLLWHPHEDTLHYRVQQFVMGERVTKRTLLSYIAQIFDPLGLIAPCTIKLKIILQQLWRDNLTWDDQVPELIIKQWNQIHEEVHLLRELSIPRRVILHRTNLQLHGFADASQCAYGACIYLVSQNSEQNCLNSRLLIAKTKVSPLKVQTIPRLELCAALLLSRLVKKVLSSMRNTMFQSINLWADSTIVLGWIRSESSTLKTFVSHRVSEIQTSTRTAVWRHVPTQCNPADVSSRGLNPRELLKCGIWWIGPEWLTAPENEWPKQTEICDQLSSELPETLICNHVQEFISPIKFGSSSSLFRLQFQMAYILRFVSNSRKQYDQRKFGALSKSELDNSFWKLVWLAQRESFSSELNSLRKNGTVESKSKLLALSPFIDSNGILRVGGRLRNSHLSYETKHSALLSDKHNLSTLIMRHTHLRSLHIGPSALVNTVRTRVWIINARNLARKIIHKCIVCFRARPQFFSPVMGDLPLTRVTQSHPFMHVGVDYGGPFLIRNSKIRGSKAYKCYIALFICFCTKAIHIELVSSLTTEAFIATLRRFVSRRGKPACIYSDNGTNFVGAKRELAELSGFLLRGEDDIGGRVALEGIDWKFSPARAPHFGGIWEAGIKSTKNHLKRIIGEQSLTYEEFNTLLVQIEGILNSRPLTALSSDPNDLSPITPAHFLIGRSMCSIPDINYMEVPENRLKAYQKIQAMSQHFWKRWSEEYLHQLQQRSKWRRNDRQQRVELGTMVLISDNLRAPTLWRIGRITELHFGKDGVARVASVHTHSGQIKRALRTLCPLPTEDEE